MRIERSHVRVFAACALIVTIITMSLVGCIDLSGRDSHYYVPVSSVKELFQVVDDGIYAFEDVIYVKTNSYNSFKEMWDELDRQNVLHTVFREKFYQVRYKQVKDGCEVQLVMTLNPCGEAMRYLYAKSVKDYKDDRAKAVGEKLLEIKAEIIRDDMSEAEKVRAIHDYIIGHYEYAVNGDVNDYAQTQVLFEQGKGQCQAYSELFVSLCLLSGVKARIISGESSFGYGEKGHAWCQVKVGALWYHVDATWDDPIPDAPGMVRYEYYLKGDLTVRKTHQWSSLFMECYADYS